MKIGYLIHKVRGLIGSNETKIKFARKEGVSIGSRCTLLGRIEWGSEPYLIEVGDDVRITSGVQFVTHDGGMHVLRNKYGIAGADLFGRIIIGDNVFIGIRSIIMPGVKIGSNVVIGAGSIVTKDIPDNVVACGVPARVVRTLDEYYEKSKNRIVMTKGMKPEDKKQFLLNHFIIRPCFGQNLK